jgi:ABC-type transporter Mla maintaining outer membrane lipid asymmetry ATPase subunit MlaF
MSGHDSAPSASGSARREGEYHRRVALLNVHGLRRSFYGVTALDGVDLAVERGTITGLIGPSAPCSSITP